MKNILIIKHGSLGDVILSLYPIFSIKKHFNKCNITILTEEKYRKIFNKLTFVNKIKIDNRARFFSIKSNLKLLIWFHREDFDWVFDLQTSKRTNLYFFIFSIYKDFLWNGIAKNCSHRHSNSSRVFMHTMERQKEQLSIAGIKTVKKINWKFLKGNLKNFCIPKNYALIIPGGSISRTEKRWPLENFITLIDYLCSLKLKSIVIGGKDEKMLFKNFVNYKAKFFNLVGRTNFGQVASLARNANLIVGNDTGPMHLSVQCALPKTKKIVLFGNQSDPKLCAPVAKNVFILRKKDIKKIRLEDVKKIIKKKT